MCTLSVEAVSYTHLDVYKRQQYYEDGRQINDEIMKQILEAIDQMEVITGKKFGDKTNPLLVSVRSGARASMPGMMDTILNLGLNEEVVETLACASGNPRWAWDCYRRFIQMFSDVVTVSYTHLTDLREWRLRSPVGK